MYRKNTAGQHYGFCLVNATTGTALTGATVTAKRSVDGAAQAAVTGTVTELGNGQYDFAPSAADLNGNQVSFLFTATGAVPHCVTVVTTAADPTSAASFGLTNLDATVGSRLATAGYTAPDNTSIAGIKTKTDSLTFTVAGMADANVVDWKGAAAPAMTGDSFARLGAPAGASVSADVAAVKGDTAAVKAKTDNLPPDPADASDIAALFTAVPAAVWGAGTRTLTASLDPTAAQIRAEIDANSTKLDVAVSTRSTYAGADTAGTTTLLARIGSALTITGGKVDVNDKTGFHLAADGLDAVVCITGMNLRQAVTSIFGFTLGKTAGNQTATVVMTMPSITTGTPWSATITSDTTTKDRTAVNVVQLA